MERRILTIDDIGKLNIESLLALIPEKRLTEYVAKCNLEAFNILFFDEELMYTCDVFLENNLNISATAKALYMHRNTLMYRLNKIRDEIGLDLRKFDMAIAFAVLSAYIKYMNKKKV